MKYFLSIIFILIGMFITIKSELMLKLFGYSGFAEGKFSMWGGSRLFYKFLGIIIIIISLMVMTGMAQSILMAIFRPVGGLGK